MSLMKEREEIKLLISEIDNRAKEEEAIKQPNAASASSCRSKLMLLASNIP